jgi:hypothetical protein
VDLGKHRRAGCDRRDEAHPGVGFDAGNASLAQPRQIGRSIERCGEVTASNLSFPSVANGTTEPAGKTAVCTSPQPASTSSIVAHGPTAS